LRNNAALAIFLTVFSASVIATETLAHEVGAAAPELQLTAADGSTRSLATAAGPTVLVFYRGLW